MNNHCPIADRLLLVVFVFYYMIGCYVFGTCYGKDDKKIVDEVIRFIRMKSFVIVIGILIINYSSTLSVMGQSSARLSLTECVRLAVAHNPTLKQTELSLYRDQINYKQAQYNRLPSLEGNIEHGYNEGRSVNATTNQFVNTSYYSGGQSLYLSAPIFNGFQILHDIRRRASAREAGKFEFESAVNELKLDVIEAYVLVLTAKDMLQQMEGQLAVTQENVDRMEVMQREGAADPGDFYDLKGQLRTDQNLLEINRQILNDRQLRLAALLNRDMEELPELEPLPFAIDQDRYSALELYDKAMNVLPQFKALDWRLQEALQQVKVTKSGYYPSLSLAASIQSRFSSIDESGFNYWQQFRNYPAKGVSLSLRVPIFSKMAVRTQVKLAKLDLDEVKWEREIRENALREETAKAVFSMKILRENVDNLREQEQSYQEAFRIAQVHFDAGNSNSVIFLTAKNKLDNTRNALVIKQYEWIMQKYINDYYAGTLDL